MAGSAYVLPGQDAAGLTVQQGGPAGGRARGQGLADQLVPEPEGAAVGGQQLAGRGPFGVVEQVDGGAAEQRREQLDVQLGADDRGGTQHDAGRPELVAAGRHRLHQRCGQLGPVRLLGQLGQEERMALGALVELIGAGRSDQLGRGRAAEQAEVHDGGTRHRRSLAGPDGGHDRGGHVLPPGEGQPAGQRLAAQVRVVDDHGQRAAGGQPPQHPDQRRVQDGRAEHAVSQDRRGRRPENRRRAGARG